MADLSNEEKKKLVNNFRFNFERALADCANSRTPDLPELQSSDGDISYGTRHLKIEVTDNFRLLVNHFCSEEADCMYSQSYWPFFDEGDRLRYTTNPDSPGHSDPKALADECLEKFISESK
jgi:hypothetical protein